MSDESVGEDSPFPRPGVMRGYPLDKAEKADLEAALKQLDEKQPGANTPKPTPDSDG